jgi:hypothetical protein
MRKSIHFALALLLGLPIAVPNGRNAAAQANAKTEANRDSREFNLFFLHVFLAPLSGKLLLEEQPKELNSINRYYSRALNALARGDKAAFYANRRALESWTAAGGSPISDQTKFVSQVAESYLDALPKKFVHGFAYLREDGTSAADPDPNIRAQLIRERGSIFGAGGGGGGAEGGAR